MELVASINSKNLRIFDLHALDKKKQQGPTTHVTRAVYGVCVDPKLDHRVASYYDNQVSSSLLLVRTLLCVCRPVPSSDHVLGHVELRQADLDSGTAPQGHQD